MYRILLGISAGVIESGPEPPVTTYLIAFSVEVLLASSACWTSFERRALVQGKVKPTKVEEIRSLSS